MQTRDLEAAIKQQQPLWASCLDTANHAPPRLVTHVENVQASVTEELKAAQRLCGGIRNAVDQAHSLPAPNSLAATVTAAAGGALTSTGSLDAAKVDALVAAASAIAAEDAAAQATLVATEAAAREALVDAAVTEAEALEIARQVREARIALDILVAEGHSSSGTSTSSPTTMQAAVPQEQTALSRAHILVLQRVVTGLQETHSNAKALAVKAGEKRKEVLAGNVKKNQDSTRGTSTIVDTRGDAAVSVVAISAVNTGSVVEPSAAPPSPKAADVGSETLKTAAESSLANSASRKQRRKHVEEALSKSAEAGTSAVHYKSDSDAEGGFEDF